MTETAKERIAHAEMLSPREKALSFIGRAAEIDDRSSALAFLRGAAKILRDAGLTLEETGLQKSDIVQIAFRTPEGISLDDEPARLYYLQKAQEVVASFPCAF